MLEKDESSNYVQYIIKGIRAIKSRIQIRVAVTANVIREIVFSLTLRPKTLFNVILNIRPPSRG